MKAYARIQTWKVALWLGLLTFVCYWGSIHGTFHFDDSHCIVDNPAVHSTTFIPQIWTDPSTSSFIPENRNYRPLTFTFFNLCWYLGGGDPIPFHLFKMFLHFWVCLAVFLIWTNLWSQKKLEPSFKLNPSWASLGLATLFAVHPACSQTVDYISASTSLQCAAFYVWGFYFYLVLRQLKARDPKFKFYFTGILVFYFCAVASKEEGITLPAAIFWADWILSGRCRASKAFIGVAIEGAILGVWLYLMHPASGNLSRGDTPSLFYFLTEWKAYLWYIRIWLFPWGLNADYASVEFVKGFSDLSVWGAGLCNLVLLGGAWSLRRTTPLAIFGLIWFYVTISPTSSVVVLAEAINEHRMYLPYVGLSGALASLFIKTAESLNPRLSTKFLANGLGVLCAIFFIGTQIRNRVWLNDESLWEDTVLKNPTSGRALNNLALVYLNRGQYALAVEYFEKCEKYWESYPYCPLNAGIAYSAIVEEKRKLGSIDEENAYKVKAIQKIEKAYSLNPVSIYNNFYLGKVYEDFGDGCRKALRYYLNSINIKGSAYPEASARVGACYRKSHQEKESIEYLSNALEKSPKNKDLLFELGLTQLQNGSFKAASQVFSEFRLLFPSEFLGELNYGFAEENLSNFSQAVEAFQLALRINPHSAEAWTHLSGVAEKMGNWNLAVFALTQLLKIEPFKVGLQKHLSELETLAGNNI